MSTESAVTWHDTGRRRSRPARARRGEIIGRRPELARPRELKRLVAGELVTEGKPGILTLIPKQT